MLLYLLSQPYLYVFSLFEVAKIERISLHKWLHFVTVALLFWNQTIYEFTKVTISQVYKFT